MKNFIKLVVTSSVLFLRLPTFRRCYPEKINQMIVPKELSGNFPRQIHVPPMIATSFSDDVS
jgi:hypothetical protein